MIRKRYMSGMGKGWVSVVGLLVVMVFIIVAVVAYIVFSSKPQPSNNRNVGVSTAPASSGESKPARPAPRKKYKAEYIDVSDDVAERERLVGLMPKSGYAKLARQEYKVMEWMNMPGLDRGREYAISQVLVNTGPLGILVLRDRKKLTYIVKQIDSGSPADGVLKLEDVIIGIADKHFADIPGDEKYRHHFPNLQFGLAVNEAESRTDGRMDLLILRRGKEQKVTLHLLPLGPDGKNFGAKNPKADYLIDLNARILAAKQLKNGWWDCGYAQKRCRYPAGRKNLFDSCFAGLALMVADADKYHDNVRRLATAMINDGDDHHFESWKVFYRALFLGEYYLRYHDQRAFKKLEKLVNQALNGGLFYEGSYGWGHNYGGGDYRYGGIAMCTSHAMMAVAIGKTAGVKLSPQIDRALTKTIERISPDGFIDYGERPQIQGPPLAIKPFNQHAGRTGIGAIDYRLMGGRIEHIKKMLHFLEMNEQYNDSAHGGGHEFSWVWSTLALGVLSDRQYQKHLKKWQWYFDFNRKWDGGFYVQPDPACIERRYELFGPTYYAATYIMILGQYRHNLAITGCKDYLLPPNQYSSPALPSLLMAERYNQLVRVSAVISQVHGGGAKMSVSLVKLLKSLKAIPIESRDWDTQAKRCYDRYLKLAVHDVLHSKLPAKQRVQAASALLGIAPYISKVSAKGGTFSFNLKLYPANTGEYKVTPHLVYGGHKYSGKPFGVSQILPRAAEIYRKFSNYNFKTGISAHAWSELVFDIGGSCKEFTALGGLWDPAFGSVRFKVFGDGKELFRSRVVRAGVDPVEVRVDLSGVQRLKLVATPAGDGKSSDYSVWFDAKLRYTDGRLAPLLVKDAVSAKVGWSRPTQNRHFTGQALDRRYRPSRDSVSTAYHLKIPANVVKNMAHDKSNLFLEFNWEGEKFSLPLDLSLPPKPVKVISEKFWSLMPWDMKYGPYEGVLLKLSYTMRIKLPGGIIWETDTTNMDVVKDGSVYEVREFLKKFGEPELGHKVRVYYANCQGATTRGAFIRLEL